MKKTNIRRLLYHARHRYFTMNNMVMGIALIVGAAWAWGSVGMMQRNFELQKGLDAKVREQTLLDLQAQTLLFEQKYYKSSEYQELAIRTRLGKTNPGEKALILPPNSQAAIDADAALTKKPTQQAEQANNFEQWMNFLFGGSRNRIQ